MYNNFHFLLTSTPPFNNFILSEEEAIKYLKYINNENFLYNNVCCYDIVDYEKICYIEMLYKDNKEIQEIIFKIKQKIFEGYEIKNQYRERVLDYQLIKQQINNTLERNGFYGIPFNEE